MASAHGCVVLLLLASAAASAPVAAPTQQAAEDSTADGPVVKLVADTPAALASALRQAASVWSVRGDTATINLRPGQLDALGRTPGLRVADVPIPDLALLVAEQEAERRNKTWTLAASQAVRGARRDPFFDTYREYEVIHLYMEALALECGPQPHPSPVPPPPCPHPLPYPLSGPPCRLTFAAPQAPGAGDLRSQHRRLLRGPPDPRHDHRRHRRWPCSLLAERDTRARVDLPEHGDVHHRGDA